MNHTAALCDAAYMTGFSAELKLYRNFLFYGVGGHYSRRSSLAAVFVQSRGKSRQRRLNGSGIERLSYNSGGGYNNILRLTAEHLRRGKAYLIRSLNAARTAGVRNSAVANASFGLSVFKVAPRYGNRRAEYRIGGVYRRAGRRNFAYNKRQILLNFVFSLFRSERRLPKSPLRRKLLRLKFSFLTLLIYI